MTQTAELDFDSCTALELETTMFYLMSKFDKTNEPSAKRVYELAIESVADVIRLRQPATPVLALVS